MSDETFIAAEVRRLSDLFEALGASIVVKPLCDQCPDITPALIHACASVGIEHGRSTGEEMALYMQSVHSKHAPTEENPSE